MMRGIESDNTMQPHSPLEGEFQRIRSDDVIPERRLSTPQLSLTPGSIPRMTKIQHRKIFKITPPTETKRNQPAVQRMVSVMLVS